MAGFLQTLKFWDWWLVAAIGGLISLGLVTLASVAFTSGEAQLFWRQLMWLAVGATLLVVFSFVDYRIFSATSRVLLVGYVVVLGMLGFLLIAGPTIRGTTSWLRLGSVFSIEPVEIAKLVTILLLAKYFSARHLELAQFRHIFVSSLYIVILAALVLVQPDFGSVAVLMAVWFGMVLIAGLSRTQVLALLAVGVVVLGLAWTFVLHDYQRVRIASYLNPGRDPQGAGYQARQALIAVGAGGWLGQGVGHGTQTGYQFLPEASSDFIFAAFAEEWGLAGISVMLGLFALVYWRLYKVAMIGPNNFARLYSGGLLTMLFVQTTVNIGMNLGALPITGLPLPFVSYGGSSLVVLCVAFGILQSMRVRSAGV